MKNVLCIIVVMIIGLILSCNSTVTHHIKNYIQAAYFGGGTASNKSASITVPHYIGTSKSRIYSSYSKSTSEDFCETTGQLEAIPADAIAQLKSIRQKCVNVALLLHVESLIKTHEVEYLKDVFYEYNKKLSLVAKFEDFLIYLRHLNSNQVKFCLKFLKTETEFRLTHFESYLALVEELSTWYNYLHRLGDYLSTYDRQKRREFFVNVTEVNFHKFTAETQKKLFSFVYPFNLTKKKILEINDVIQKWMKPVKVEVRNGSYIFSNRVVLLSEIKNIVPDGVDSVYVFCSYTLYLDEDVTLPGVSLGIVAPRWAFLKRVRINLSGVDGPEHEEGPKGAGKPGNPGGNAGDFLGLGDWNENYLIVLANGGRGGKGQNGARGRDGVDHTRPDPPFRKPRCLSRINAFQNSYNQTITHYKIFGESGCGGPGSDGGVGGKGGKGGVIILINDSVKITKGSDGESGSPGRGGIGGAGGKDGCFYEVLDVDNEVLHRITNVKCIPGNNLPSGKSGKDDRNRKGLLQPRKKSNLSGCDCIVDFILSLDFDKNKNLQMISTLRKLNRYDSSTECVLKKYNAYKKYDNIELYDIFRKEIHSTFKYLNSILLARILTLKSNVNFFFIDYDNYLNVIEKSIKNANGKSRKLPPVLYLKEKVAAKAEKLLGNLKAIKEKLTNLDELEEFGSEKKISCVMLATIDAMFFLTNRPSPERIRKLDNFIRDCLAPEEYIIDANTQMVLAQNEEFEVLKIETEDVGEYLRKLKDALDYLRESVKIKADKKKLLRELLSEMTHLVALNAFVEWEDLARSFLRSLDVSANAKESGEEEEFLKTELLDALIALQYKLAEDAARQRENPFINWNTHLQMTDGTTFIEEIMNKINILRESPTPNGICKNEVEAYFGENSAVGEFYYWPNSDVRNELEALFSGSEIRLESNLVNRHVFDKNFIRFKSVKLEFESSDANLGKLLQNILFDYKMAITHSGYSHYNWLGDSRVVVGEEITVQYSFKARENGEPELYSVLYKKVQEGKIILSPYTTWTIRLIPINEMANYQDLKSYKDKVSLRLTGIGTFIP